MTRPNGQQDTTPQTRMGLRLILQRGPACHSDFLAEQAGIPVNSSNLGKTSGADNCREIVILADLCRLLPKGEIRFCGTKCVVRRAPGGDLRPSRAVDLLWAA
jgi:hypothetical protein